MKRTLLAAFAALTLIAGSQGLAQVTTDISAEQRARIKDYIIKEKVQPVVVNSRLVVGATVPSNVSLIPAPPSWGASFLKYQFIYADNHVMIVDPASRKIVQVIE